MTLSHCPCLTWKFLTIWFHKILKLIFQTLPSCTEHWKKLPNLTALLEICLYLKNNDSVKHVQNVLLIVLFIYFQGKIKFSQCIWSIWLIWIFIFSSTILLSKMKLLFFSLWTKIWQILHVILESTNQFSFKFCITLPCHQM